MRYVGQAFRAAPIVGLTVTVGTEKIQVLRAIIEPIAIFVVDVQDKGLPQPIRRDSTARILAFMDTAHLDQGAT